MRSLLRAVMWTAAALAVGLLVAATEARGDDPHARNKSGGNSGTRASGRNSGGGQQGSGNRGQSSGGQQFSSPSAGQFKPSTGPQLVSPNTGNLNGPNLGQSNLGQNYSAQRYSGQRNSGQSNSGQTNSGKTNTNKMNTGKTNTGQSNTGQSNTGKTNSGKTNSGKTNSGSAGKIIPPGGGKSNSGNTGVIGKSGAGSNKTPLSGSSKPGNSANKITKSKGTDQGKWNNWSKNGWNKSNWNNAFNSQHHNHHHGYWNNGLWIAPWVILYSQPWVYLQPATPIVVGQKWLGVSYEPYDGGGSYVTAVYEGSPAQQVGLEVGDVIVSINGIDATNLPAAVQAAPDIAQLQVLSARTGELLQAEVNLIH